jgi:hypothetical protein
MEVTKANLATYLAGLAPSATPYQIEITETVASDWGSSDTDGTVGYILKGAPSGVLYDLSGTVIPNSVTNMPYTLQSCTALTTAPVIPNSVTHMYETFHDCTALHTIQNFAVNVDNCDMTNAFQNCPALANIYVTTSSESSWHLLHTNTDATGTDYTIYNPDGTIAGSGTVAGTSQVLTLYGKSDELVISANITPTLAKETATTQVQWHKSGLPYDDELMIFNAKNPDTVISNFITVNRAGEEFLGNSATATKLATARKIGSVDFDGSEDITARQILAPINVVSQITVNISGGQIITSGNQSYCLFDGKDIDICLAIEGLMTVTPGTLVFTLPAAYRSGQYTRITAGCDYGSGPSRIIVGCDINPNGEARIYPTSGLTLSGVTGIYVYRNRLMVGNI